jgi:hypothetical protein
MSEIGGPGYALRATPGKQGPEYRQLNKKIRTAILDQCELYWEFGTFRTYYRGMILRAVTGIRENGTVRSHIIFSTENIETAEDLRAILHECARDGVVENDGWERALQKYQDYKSGWSDVCKGRP